jgi:hypothetical protein
MWRRKAFKQACGGFSHIRGKAAGWANRNPKAMIAGMFCVMAVGIVWLLASPREGQRSFDDSIKLLYSGFNKPQQSSSVATDALEAWHLYSRVQSLDPDSVTARDSTILKEIDRQLNRIIHE